MLPLLTSLTNHHNHHEQQRPPSALPPHKKIHSAASNTQHFIHHITQTYTQHTHLRETKPPPPPLQTTHKLREKQTLNDLKVFNTTTNGTKIEEDEVPDITDPFFLIETICIIWFTFELSVRWVWDSQFADVVSLLLSVLFGASVAGGCRLFGRYPRRPCSGSVSSAQAFQVISCGTSSRPRNRRLKANRRHMESLVEIIVDK